jgi:hypothetical protein
MNSRSIINVGDDVTDFCVKAGALNPEIYLNLSIECQSTMLAWIEAACRLVKAESKAEMRGEGKKKKKKRD